MVNVKVSPATQKILDETCIYIADKCGDVIIKKRYDWSDQVKDEDLIKEHVQAYPSELWI